MPKGPARYRTICRVCDHTIDLGEMICWGKSKARHLICPSNIFATPVPVTQPEFIEDTTAVTYQTEDDDYTYDTQTEETTPMPSSTPANNSLAETLTEAILPYLEDRLSAKPDTENIKELVNELVDAKLDGLTARVEVFDRATRETTVLEGLQHKLFAVLLKLVQVKHVWLFGAAGGGKTTVARQIAEALKLRFESISIVAQTAPSALLGFIDAHGKLVRTPFREVWENGGVFLIDEICAGTGNFLTVLNSALDNGHCAFPDGNVSRHTDFICIAADNTPGVGASHLYNGRNKLDAATRERFLFLKWEYDEKLERTLALGVNPKAAAWVDWIQTTRRIIETLNLQMVASPRASILGAELLSIGFTVEDTAEAVFFKGVDESTKAKLLSNNYLPEVN